MVTILTMAEFLITRFVQQVLRLKMSTFIGRLDLILSQVLSFCLPHQDPRDVYRCVHPQAAGQALEHVGRNSALVLFCLPYQDPREVH